MSKMVSAVDPTTSDPGAVVRVAADPWQHYWTPPGTSPGELVKVVQTTPGKVVSFGAVNIKSLALYLSFHDKVNGNDLTSNTMRGLPWPVPAKVHQNGRLHVDLVVPMCFATGIVVAVSSTDPNYTAGVAGQELYFQVWYK